MMKDNKYMEELIERFFAGETTHAEEDELYAFFAQKDIPESLEKYKPVFGYFTNDMEDELEELQQQEAFTAKPPTTWQLNKKWISWAGAAAAALLLLIALNGYFPGKEQLESGRDTYIVYDGKKITNTDHIAPEVKSMLQNIYQNEAELSELSELALRQHYTDFYIVAEGEMPRPACLIIETY